MPNRPMLSGDLDGLAQSPWPAQIRRLVRDFKAAGFPVLNGSFRYSSLTEGPSQAFTCNPYRLWEYSSLLEHISQPTGHKTFVDVGGAGSALPYVLAQAGHQGLAVDAQPWLADLCGHIARERKLPLQAMAASVTHPAGDWGGPYDLVICVSVLEHIHPEDRASAIRQLHTLCKPGGALYLTFDYGTYQSDTKAPGPSFSQAIPDIGPLCQCLCETGFRFQGNDPRTLPPEVLATKSAPANQQVYREHVLTFSAVDSGTPLRSLLGHGLRRMGWLKPPGVNRFAHHNFFRMFLERPTDA